MTINMKIINIIILILFLIMMIIGMGTLIYGGPESNPKTNNVDDWNLAYIANHIAALGFSIVGAIGFFTELLYFNLKINKNL